MDANNWQMSSKFLCSHRFLSYSQYARLATKACLLSSILIHPKA